MGSDGCQLLGRGEQKRVVVRAGATGVGRVDASVGGRSIRNGRIGNRSVSNGSIGNRSIGTGSVGNGSIGNGSIGNGSIGNGSIGDGSVSNGRGARETAARATVPQRACDDEDPCW